MSSTPNRGMLRVFLLLGFVFALSFASITLMGRFQAGRGNTRLEDEYAQATQTSPGPEQKSPAKPSAEPGVSLQESQYLETFNQAVDLIEKTYVKEVEPKTLYYGAIQGMLYNLDPHSSFFPPDYFKDVKVELQGQFGGLGIEVGVKDGRLAIMSPIEDTPASRAGLKSGDIIFKIDGVITEGMSLTDAVHKMRGKPGTQVTLTIVREGWPEPKDFRLTREVIQINSVKKAELIDGKFGYIRLAVFNENTSRDLRQAVQTVLAKAGGKLSGLILDLRNNPGGQLEQALEVAETFISEGPIVSTKGRLNDSNKTFYAHKQKAHTDFPMVVIVNSGSASASEILAAALKDSGRALVLGTKTYGKGSVQSLYTLKDGSGIKVTTAYYYTPSGTSIQAEGITPDILVEDLSPEDMARLEGERRREEETRFREQNLPGYITQEEVQQKQQAKPADKKQEPPTFEELVLKDYQLRRSVEILKSWVIFQGQVKKAAANP